MHILFLSDNFPPEVNAPASRTFEHCREWVKLGHQVTVVTCAPNFPSGKVFAGYQNKLWQQEEMEGIRVIRVWSYITANEGFVKRVLDYMTFMVTAIFASFMVRKVDIVVGTSPQFFTACAAYLVGFCKNRPWVFELRDLWPESIHAVGAMRQSRLLDWLEKLELFLYRKASMVVSVTHAFKDNLIRRGVDPEKVEVITNGVDLSQFSPREKDRELIKRLGLEGKFIAGYIGTHGMAHGLDTILDAAKLASSRGLDCYRILMLGDGSEKQRLKKKAEEDGLSNIIFIETVPKSQVPMYWSIVDAAIVHLVKSETFKSVIPSKIFESMAMGVPILHGVEGESAKIVKENNVGLPFMPESPERLLEALDMLKTNPEIRKSMKIQCQIAAQKYQRNNLAKLMLEKLESLVKAATP